MSLLKIERATLTRYLPELAPRLGATPLMTLEEPGSGAIQAFRECHGPGLLIPRELGGLGATALDAVRIHRVLGSLSPSMAVATTMHDFTVVTLVEFGIFGGDEGCAALLQAVADNDMLMASGFAEGRSGTNILAATMEARQTEDGGYVLAGSKKPCSLSRSMDLLSGSAILRCEGAPPRRAIVLVPADTPGLERRPFWGSSVLTAAESEEVVLDGVVIPGDLLFFPDKEDELDAVEVAGYVWFQLLVTASYVGVATALVERALASGKGGASERERLAIEIEGAMSALEGVARALDAREPSEDLLPRALLVRYSVQRSIERAAMEAAELLGGMAFISSPEVAYLLAASRALAFHPPSRLGSAEPLSRYLAGERLVAV
ncbi:MAG: acyl-CoA/acyl-ACP dehydrogenase [Myxococcales bacterium]|nr:acyl-CoA/acyl-ACP dehydrogenase [Myxococcales bacterium]